MKLFKKAIALLLLIMMALLPAMGLAESEEEGESQSAFEALRELMETQYSPDIPVALGEVFTNIVIDDEVISQRVTADPKKNKESSYHKTPGGVLCQILFENAQDSRLEDITDKDGQPIQQYKIINSAINNNYQYEAVRYNWLTLEQMLYYAYTIGSNYSVIQDKLPAGETFSIAVKYGKEILLINDAESAKQFTDSVVEMVIKLAENGTPAN